MDAIFLAGPLHDIGKIGIPDCILLKPDCLLPEERKIMEGHCAIGAKFYRISLWGSIITIYGDKTAGKRSPQIKTNL